MTTPTRQEARRLVLRLPFDRPPMTMNDLRRKGHWTQQQEAHDDVRDTVWALCRQQRVEPFVGPVTVTLTWHAKGRGRRDPDALGVAVKGALDGLTAAKVLRDDDSVHVPDVHLAVRVGSDDPRVELTVAEVES